MPEFTAATYIFGNDLIKDPLVGYDIRDNGILIYERRLPAGSFGKPSKYPIDHTTTITTRKYDNNTGSAYFDVTTQGQHPKIFGISGDAYLFQERVTHAIDHAKRNLDTPQEQPSAQKNEWKKATGGNNDLENFFIIIPPMPESLYKFIIDTKYAIDPRLTVKDKDRVKRGDILSYTSPVSDGSLMTKFEYANYAFGKERGARINPPSNNSTVLVSPISGKVLDPYDSGNTCHDEWDYNRNEPCIKFGYYLPSYCRIIPEKEQNIENATSRAYSSIITWASKLSKDRQELLRYGISEEYAKTVLAEPLERDIEALRRHKTEKIPISALYKMFNPDEYTKANPYFWRTTDNGDKPENGM